MGLTHFEGRPCVGLVRHPLLTLVVMGFVAVHTERLRGKKPPRDAREQVCRALNAVCRRVFRRRRGVPDLQRAGEVIRYHQRRNTQATASHKKRPHRCVI